MPIRIVRLGEARAPDEGLRIGTVRRPPRGVARGVLAERDWYDIWFPNLAPSAGLVAMARTAETARQWNTFVRRYRAEMALAENSRTLDVLAALSRQTNFSVGCYCADEARCHRSVLRTLLQEHGAEVFES